MEKILTVNNVAEILQVKAITVREMFREKRLRGFKVGKSWRTTEVLLREDIDALARGESPAALPMPMTSATASPAASPAISPPAPVAAAPRPVPAAPTPATPPVPTPTPVDDAGVSPAPKGRPTKKATPPADKDEGADDTQQLLF